MYTLFYNAGFNFTLNFAFNLVRTVSKFSADIRDIQQRDIT